MNLPLALPRSCVVDEISEALFYRYVKLGISI